MLYVSELNGFCAYKVQRPAVHVGAMYVQRPIDTPLNTDTMSDAASGYYGKIIHPTIDGIVRMIHDFRTEAKRVNP
jgi:hypothetical protein